MTVYVKWPGHMHIWITHRFEFSGNSYLSMYCLQVNTYCKELMASTLLGQTTIIVQDACTKSDNAPTRKQQFDNMSITNADSWKLFVQISILLPFGKIVALCHPALANILTVVLQFDLSLNTSHTAHSPSYSHLRSPHLQRCHTVSVKTMVLFENEL